MSARDFEVRGEDELRIRDLAHQLIDACRSIVAKQTATNMTPDLERRARTTATISMATQAIYMADHLGGKGYVEGKPSQTMEDNLIGIADGLGCAIGCSANPLQWADQTLKVERTMEAAIMRRGMITMAEAAAHRRKK